MTTEVTLNEFDKKTEKFSTRIGNVVKIACQFVAFA